jgi:mandelamide amidase
MSAAQQLQLTSVQAVEAMRSGRLSATCADYFSANRFDAMLFPTTILPAAPIDTVNGSGKVSIDGGAPVDTFATYIRNTDPGSNAGIPGLSLPAGLTAAGLPVGIELDGPVGSDSRLIGIGLAFEAVLGTLPPPRL